MKLKHVVLEGVVSALIKLVIVSSVFLCWNVLGDSYSWLNINTNNYAYYETVDGNLVGYVIDDKNTRSSGSTWRDYSGDMVFEFYGGEGILTMSFTIDDLGDHYNETVILHAYNNDNDQFFYKSYSGDGKQKTMSIEFTEAGWHRIVIHSSYSRVYSRAYLTRGCVTTFSRIEWICDPVIVPKEIVGEKELVVPYSWVTSLDSRFGMGTSVAFVEKFGKDLSVALLKPSGKKNVNGGDMYVWQDFIAGTNPLDMKSKLMAKIEMFDGGPIVSWSPKLSDTDTAERVYTIYGKKTLDGTDLWTPVETPAQGGWRFFKVGVEMR